MWWLWAVWLVVFGLTAWLEAVRFLSAVNSPLGVVSWLTFWDMETTLPFLFLLVLPVLMNGWFATGHELPKGRIRKDKAERCTEAEDRPQQTALKTASGCLTVFAVSLLCSYRIGAEPVSLQKQFGHSTTAFSDLPPAYHDEYSYLLQARTFLAGRISWPGMAVRPDLFHQIHVLNEHRTVSRYFPWTGLWMAPFEATGHAVYGHWLAGALAAMFFYLSLLQVSDARAAFGGGLLIALSPGIAVFSNLLLAHHPTLLALSVFTWSFFRMMSTHRLLFACVSGTALTLAMLGRPMTAAGFALPFGIRLLWFMVRYRKLWPATGFVIPLGVGFTVLAVLNYDATGSAVRTAYQEYTETYTPSHRYGFNNAVRDNQGPGPKVLTAYDQWATNLTPAAAARNVWNRLFYSFQWSLAVLPLLFGLLMAGPTLWLRFSPSASEPDSTRGSGLKLLLFSFLSLHVVHIPYWFDGIMHWHYVFETAPLILMLAAVGMIATYDTLRSRANRFVAAAWVSGFVISGLLPGWFALAPYESTSKISAAISELSFARNRFEYFRQTTVSEVIAKPALILVDERSSDPQLSYIVNDPLLDSDVITCRRPATDEEIEELTMAFPDRTVYFFDPNSLMFAKR